MVELVAISDAERDTYSYEPHGFRVMVREGRFTHIFLLDPSHQDFPDVRDYLRVNNWRAVVCYKESSIRVLSDPHPDDSEIAWTRIRPFTTPPP